MPHLAGTTLGPYEITGSLGAGGMGEVYRATDTNLKRAGRDQGAARGRSPPIADRLARFQREAEVLAVAQSSEHRRDLRRRRAPSGTTALVMELVEGPTLDD